MSSLLFNQLTLASAEEEEEEKDTTSSTTLTRPRHLTGGSPSCKYFSRCIATAPQLCTAIPLGRVTMHWERTAGHIGNQNIASKVALVCQNFQKGRARRTFQNHFRTFVCLLILLATPNLQVYCNLPYKAIYSLFILMKQRDSPDLLTKPSHSPICHLLSYMQPD